jgi:hypothetical protein
MLFASRHRGRIKEIAPQMKKINTDEEREARAFDKLAVGAVRSVSLDSTEV